MQDYQQRVITEKAELDAKLAKLISFMATETFQSLSADEQDRMKRQSGAMYRYSSILGERIADFE